jgi:O-antigen ligase
MSAAFSVDVSASLIDLGRQAYIVIFCILLMLTVRRPNARANLATVMIMPTLLGMALTLYMFWKFGTGISNDALHEFKASASASFLNITMNPLAGIVVLTFFATLPAVFRFRHLIWVSAALLVPILVLTGARSTMVALPLAVLLFLVIRFFSRLPLLPRLLALASSVTLLIAVAVATRVPVFTVDTADELTTHRVYLWQAAITRFAANQWFGAGADTWRLDLTAVLPAEARESKGLLELSSGAYHNAYLTFLAERGLVVCIPALFVLSFVLRSAFRVYTCRKLLAPGDRVLAQFAPTMVLFIMIRQLAECSGLLAYADGPADFASFILASLIIALEGDLGQVASTVPSQQLVALESAAAANYL